MSSKDIDVCVFAETILKNRGFREFNYRVSSLIRFDPPDLVITKRIQFNEFLYHQDRNKFLSVLKDELEASFPARVEKKISVVPYTKPTYWASSLPQRKR